MYCKYCGNQIDNDSIFCTYCGKKILNKMSAQDKNESLSSNPERTVKNGIIYEDGYPIGRVPSYCNPQADKITEW